MDTLGSSVNVALEVTARRSLVLSMPMARLARQLRSKKATESPRINRMTVPAIRNMGAVFNCERMLISAPPSREKFPPPVLCPAALALLYHGRRQFPNKLCLTDLIFVLLCI